MPTVNKEDLQPQIAEILQSLITAHQDPLDLAIAVWNASFVYEQGEKNVADN